jgi:hypothetical protein
LSFPGSLNGLQTDCWTDQMNESCVRHSGRQQPCLLFLGSLEAPLPTISESLRSHRITHTCAGVECSFFSLVKCAHRPGGALRPIGRVTTASTGAVCCSVEPCEATGQHKWQGSLLLLVSPLCSAENPHRKSWKEMCPIQPQLLWQNG